MIIGKMMRTALRIWLMAVIINGVMIGFWSGEWGIAAAITVVALVITLPIPFAAKYCLKLSVRVSKSIAVRFSNAFFFLIFLASLFWIMLIAGLDGPNIVDAISRGRELPSLIGLNFLSILIACVCSIEQINRLDDVTSEESVIS